MKYKLDIEKVKSLDIYDFLEFGLVLLEILELDFSKETLQKYPQLKDFLKNEE